MPNFHPGKAGQVCDYFAIVPCAHQHQAWEHTKGFLILQKEGFSDAVIDRFFKPFLGGIFFNRELSVTSRLFEFVMRCLATGSNCLPSQGIGAVAKQLASGLPEGSIHLGLRDLR